MLVEAVKCRVRCRGSSGEQPCMAVMGLMGNIIVVGEFSYVSSNAMNIAHFA